MPIRPSKSTTNGTISAHDTRRDIPRQDPQASCHTMTGPRNLPSQTRSPWTSRQHEGAGLRHSLRNLQTTNVTTVEGRDTASGIESSLGRQPSDGHTVPWKPHMKINLRKQKTPKMMSRWGTTTLGIGRRQWPPERKHSCVKRRRALPITDNSIRPRRKDNDQSKNPQNRRQGTC